MVINKLKMKRRNLTMNLRTMTLLCAMIGIFYMPVAHAVVVPDDGDQKVAAASYPKEALGKRLKNITNTYQVEIIFDLQRVEGKEAAACEKKTPEADLEASLAGTGFSYKKDPKGFYTISEVKDDAPQQKKTAPKRGSVSGTVLDSHGFPIPGASVLVAGTDNGVATGLKGEFTLTNVPNRPFTVEVRCVSYATIRISDVKVRPGQTTPLDVVLQDDTETLQEVVVTASYNKASAKGLYAKQKAMVAMSDGVSADLIKKTADNNVAQVLKRVSGVTVENGKYVTVRGLGERYNNVQLNGSSLPSTEPNRRNFSFDIIPTALIDNVTIAKTFTPDMPGEFTGGLVEVNTLAVPEKRLIQLSVGTGINTNSTGKTFKSTKRLDGDYMFGNSRDWYGTIYQPEVVNNMFKDGIMSYDQLTADQQKTLNAMNAKVPNYWGFRKFKGAPTQNYALTIGLPFDLGNNNKLGVIASATYRHEETTEDLQKAFYISNSDSLIQGNRYKFVTATGAVLNVGWERPGHKVTWRNLFNNRFTHTNTERTVYNDDAINHYRLEQNSNPLINRLWQTQLSGEHQLPLDMKLSWTGDYSKLKRLTPDDRFTYGEIMSDPHADYDSYLVNWMFPIYTALNEGYQMYSKLEEEKKNIGANLEYPFIVEGNQQKLKVGYMGTFRSGNFSQDYLQTRVAFGGTDGRDPLPGSIGCELEDKYASDLYADGKLYLRSAGRLKNYYDGTLDIHAAYLMGEFTFWKKLHLTAGVRMEAGNMEVLSAYDDIESQKPIDTTLVAKKTDWLPAVTAVYNITDNLNFRAAYSKTLARPDFRELAVTQYYNVDDRIIVKNMGNIRQTYTDNVDVRFEWYPQAGEVISLSGFYKKFKDPVELISLKNANDGSGYTMYSFNLKSATALGLELNVRKSFGFLAPASFLNDLYFTGNATILKGNVDYSIWELIDQTLGTDYGKDSYASTKRERPLLGLVPYAVNAGLSYSGKCFGAAINYGTTGRKLVQAGMYEKYDEYEAPRHVLDLQISAKFLKDRLEVKANASDLLNSVYRVYRNCSMDIVKGNNTEPDKGYTDRTGEGMNYNEGDWIVNQYKRGTTYSLSVSYKF